MFPSEYAEERWELHKILRSCHIYLAENMELTRLLPELQSYFVVAEIDVEIIRAQTGSFKQNCRLLDILQMKPPSHLELFIESLVKTNQTHIARKVDPNGNTILSNYFHKIS